MMCFRLYNFIKETKPKIYCFVDLCVGQVLRNCMTGTDADAENRISICLFLLAITVYTLELQELQDVVSFSLCK